ncbi:hypothetical protein [Halopiger xanaduensis]|uniref:DUF7975 domain-containing protein n=1 Tax=Halopiger xanaduensis (strain DSM 18323 / JCM 14033 / SH-6) TaxID=797210 RepID=F8D8E9_HALXS|nr:hypothetical protein [Halopiger xanaduensis]AEH35572.1 hypothetical protein Halxa_0936 [Halopiger xanaduensis SH-6]
MTRFDAADPAERRKLYVDAITAHRERASGFLTLEVDPSALESTDESETTDGNGDGDELGTGAGVTPDDRGSGLDPELGVPWLQFGDGTINLDCTDEELDALKDLLSEFPAFKVDELTRPENAEGVNARVSAKADQNRIAQFIDATFQRVYGLPEGFRVWVVEV